MYAVLGEDKSDVEMINVLIRRISGKPNLTVKRMGYTGCAELLAKGARMVKSYKAIGCTHFIICYDSDRDDAGERYQRIVNDIIIKSGVDAKFCALVPVQEIESWIFADISAVSKVITSWRPNKLFPSPENLNDPKETLEKLSRTDQQKPLYSHATHNEKVAQFLDLKEIAKKCPSSIPLFEIMHTGQGNYPKFDGEKVRNQVLERLNKQNAG